MLGNAKTVSNQTVVTSTSLLPHLNLIFTIAFAIFVLGPPFLGYQFAPYPLMHIADIFDIFTPLVILPSYWLLFRWDGTKPANVKEYLVFMVLAGFWVLGHGMHLSANSIGNLLATQGIKSGALYDLTYFYDEILGHYLWHLGTIGLSGLLIYRQWYNPSNIKSITKSNLIAGLIYGFVFFAMAVEGTTVPMALPFSILAIAFITIWGRKSLQQPLIFSYLVGYSFTLMLLAVWGIWHRGFPGFFDSGFIAATGNMIQNFIMIFK
jgi:hypothetical protein